MQKDTKPIFKPEFICVDLPNLHYKIMGELRDADGRNRVFISELLRMRTESFARDAL